ncbi:MAG: hypothetical protein WA231_04645 [Methylocella sp.]
MYRVVRMGLIATPKAASWFMAILPTPNGLVPTATVTTTVLPGLAITEILLEQQSAVQQYRS